MQLSISLFHTSCAAWNIHLFLLTIRSNTKITLFNFSSGPIDVPIPCSALEYQSFSSTATNVVLAHTARDYNKEYLCFQVQHSRMSKATRKNSISALHTLYCTRKHAIPTGARAAYMSTIASCSTVMPCSRTV